ncbi:MAG: hypothetical protein J6O56_05030 [Bacilli bacterium]|nr:hypothetical protein [Bacilli bacterium]
MFNSLLFIISFLLLFVLLLLVYKKDEKFDLLIHGIINFIFVTIINSTIVFVSSFVFKISSPLIVRSIIFILLSLFIALKIKKDKKIQKYKINKVNFIFLLMIIIFCSYIGLRRFGLNMNLIFETTDPAAHMLSSQRFAESDKLLENSKKDYAYGGSKKSRGLFYSYTTVGTMFEIEKGFGGNFYTYTKTFIFTEIAFFILVGIVSFYLIVSCLKKTKLLKEILYKLLSLIIVFLMLYAYPYNSMIFGFHYINIFLLISLLILALFKEFNDDYLNKYYLLYISFYNFFIFATYYMFVPVVFGAEGIYYLYLCFINKKYNLKEVCRIIIITLVIPFIIGMLYYFITPMFYKSSGSSTSPFKAEGYIYRNLLGSVILLVPGFLINTINEIKNKKISLLSLTILFEFMFMFVIFYTFYKGSSASYYFYKNYYLLSPLLYINLGIMIAKREEVANVGFSLLFLVFFTFCIYKFNIENRLRSKNILIDPIPYIDGLTNIYNFNDLKENEKPIYYDEQIKDLSNIVDEYKDKFEYNNFFYYSPSLLKRLWCYDALRIPYTPKYKVLNDFYLELKEQDEILNYDNLEYILVDKSEKINSDRIELIEKNNSFELYKIKE